MANYILVAKPFGYDMFTESGVDIMDGGITDVESDAAVYDSEFDSADRTISTLKSFTTFDFEVRYI